MSDPVLFERLEAVKVSRLDIFVFLGSFVGGLTVYGLLRALGVPYAAVTVWLIVVMVAYAVAVAKIPRLRVRLDQAGDNAYYLGLLFTLVSMAVALYQFGSAVSADRSVAQRIIGNFGIALATTIAGIFLRVLLHQMRVDPADVESMTRIELAEAAKRVKASLDTVSIEMGRMMDEMRQRAGDQLGHLVDEVAKTLGGFTSRVNTATTELTDATTAAHLEAIGRVSDVSKRLVDVAGETEAVADRLRKVEPPPVEWAARLDSVSNSFAKVAADAERASSRLIEAGAASAGIGDALTSASTMLVNASVNSTRQHQDTVRQMQEAAMRLREVLEAVGTTLDEDRKRLSTLEEQSRKSGQAAVESQEAANRVLDSLVTMAQGLTKFVNERG